MSKKTPLMQMTPEQVAAGKAVWARTEQEGRVLGSSADFEGNALKTWIRYQNSKGELKSPPIECELYFAGRRSDESEGVAMLHGMCPKCHETFVVQEDNKTMFLGETTYRKAPEWIKEQWERVCHERGLPALDDDKIPLVSSRERWQCDYCLSWAVRVTDGVAVDDHRGATVLYVPLRGPTYDHEKKQKGKIVDI